MARRNILILLGVLAASGGAAAYYLTRPLPVTVAKAQSGPAADLVYATGYVEAQQPVSVSSRITAPVAQVLVKEGDAVRRGQALALLSADEQRATLDQAGAQQKSAEAVEGRTTALFKQGWVTAAARDNAKAAADAARAASGAARARLDQLTVRANSDGIITKRDVYPGDMALPTKVMFQIGDPAKTRVTATVDERDIARVKVGQAALMSSDAWPGRVIHGAVAEITPSGDPTTRAFRVRLNIADAPDLPMGLTLEINIIARERSAAVLVPTSAVAGNNVWIVAQGHAQPRTITKGAVGAQMVEVTTGLRVGEVVVLAPPANLIAGQAITPKAP